MNTTNAPDRGETIRYCLDGRTATAHFPGVGRYTASLAQGMAPLLHSHERLCILRDPKRPSLFEAFSDLPENTEIVDLAVTPFSPSQQWKVPSLLRQKGVSVYHSPYTLLPYASHLPTLLTVHDIIPLLFPGESTSKARLLFSTALRLALRKARLVIAVSEQTRKDLEQRFRPREVRVIPEAAASHFRPATAEAVAALRRRLQLPPAYALYLGSAKPHKNLGLLLELWMGAAMPWPLVVAGVPTGHASGVSEEARRSSAVVLAGKVDDRDLPALYSGAALFIFPSLYEGFGLPVLEAMACGAAVLCSNRASLPEVGGDAAAYVDPTDAAAMAAAVRELAASPGRLQSMRGRSLEQAARFSWKRTAAMTLSCYRELAQEKPSLQNHTDRQRRQ